VRRAGPAARSLDAALRALRGPEGWAATPLTVTQSEGLFLGSDSVGGVGVGFFAGFGSVAVGWGSVRGWGTPWVRIVRMAMAGP